MRKASVKPRQRAPLRPDVVDTPTKARGAAPARSQAISGVTGSVRPTPQSNIASSKAPSATQVSKVTEKKAPAKPAELGAASGTRRGVTPVEGARKRTEAGTSRGRSRVEQQSRPDTRARAGASNVSGKGPDADAAKKGLSSQRPTSSQQHHESGARMDARKAVVKGSGDDVSSVQRRPTSAKQTTGRTPGLREQQLGVDTQTKSRREQLRTPGTPGRRDRESEKWQSQSRGTAQSIAKKREEALPKQLRPDQPHKAALAPKAEEPRKTEPAPKVEEPRKTEPAPKAEPEPKPEELPQTEQTEKAKTTVTRESHSEPGQTHKVEQAREQEVKETPQPDSEKAHAVLPKKRKALGLDYSVKVPIPLDLMTSCMVRLQGEVLQMQSRIDSKICALHEKIMNLDIEVAKLLGK